MSDKTRCLTIGDPHYRLSNLRDARLFRAKVVEVIKKTRPHIVIILGDLHNDFERIHSNVMAEICALFRDIRAAMHSRKVYYVVGNHDAINNQIFLADDHAFLPFKEWEGVTIVDRVTAIGPFLAVPYVPPGRFHEALATTQPEGAWRAARAIFCHQEFRGVQLGPITSRHGDEWPEAAPLVVSGHIHEHQWLQKNILYVGAPFDTGFGEEGTKTVSILDFDADGTMEHARVDLGMPRRKTVTATIAEAMEYQKPDNVHVRMYVTGTTEELVAFKKTSRYKELSQILKIIPKPTDPVVVRRNEGCKAYLDILKELVAEESEQVQEALREIMPKCA